jgi:hypothetical protein
MLIVAATAVGVFGLQSTPQTGGPEDPGLQFDNPATLDSIIVPYVAMAHRTYPDAKARFLKGLPTGDKFLITTRVFDKLGNFQQIFVEVSSIKDGKVTGYVAMAGGNIPSLTQGSPFNCVEEDILDWCIIKPDGQQEGNVIGKFLDVVRERMVGLVMQIMIARDGTVSSAKFVRALNGSQQDVTFCITDAVMRRAETMARTIKYDPPDSVVTKFTYLVFDYVGNRIMEPNKDQTKKAGGPNGSK